MTNNMLDENSEMVRATRGLKKQMKLLRETIKKRTQMKLLRETIRRLLLEARSASATDFLVSLQREFDYVRQNKYRTPIFEMKFPDGCRVEFGIAFTDDNEAHIDYVETIGDDCFRKGYASIVMKKILMLLDKYSLSAILKVESFGSGGMDDNNLSQWYQSMGFEHARGPSLGFDALRRHPSP